MRIFRKLYFFTTRLLAGALVFVVFLLGGAYWLATRSLPDYQKNYALEGISGEVTIIRDKYAIPYISGETDEDVYFALGFAHAQDRLWQMVLMRRTAQGRLSEIFGPRTLDIDELMRRFDFYTLAERSTSVQTPSTIAALEAYSAGVNAWIKKVREGGLGRGALEFFIFSGGRIALWRPADSLSIGKLMALDLTNSLWNEVLRAKLLGVVDEARMRDLMPEDGGQAIIMPESGAGLSEWLKSSSRHQIMQMQDYQEERRARGPLNPLNPAPDFGMGGASNAWAAAPERSARGGTLLATDPHLGLEAPTIWYLARLGLEKGPLIGATIPGAPVVLIGRSDVHGWGLTTTGIDDIDVVMEQLNLDNPSEYLSPDGYKPFIKRRSIIRVKGQDAHEIVLRWSQNGPIFPRCYYSLCHITPLGHVPAISWSALSHPDTTASAFIGFMDARNVEEMLLAGEYVVAPGQNLIAADKEKIAFQMVGRMPRRDILHQSQGRIPTFGTRAENLWKGFFPYSLNPRVVEPKDGIIGNTNNKITDNPFPLHISHSVGDRARILRWQKLMNDQRFHTRESFIEVQSDTVSTAARLLLPLIARNLWYSAVDSSSDRPNNLRKDALEILAEWNGDMDTHIPEPLIYNAWMIELQKRLIQDELGKFDHHFSGHDPIFLERVFRDTDGASVWCDIVQTQKKETCNEIARAALDEALFDLQERLGGSVKNWRWGDLHYALHKNPAFGDTDYIKWFFNITHPSSGADNTLSNAKMRGWGDDPFVNIHGGQFRAVYDFYDPDSSVYVIATGQSGHPLSRHYDDLNVLWRRGQYIPMSTDLDFARAGTSGITTLTPLASQ